MKTPNKHLIRIVAATTTTGLITGSCEQFDNDFFVNSDQLPPKGTHALELDISKGELDYLRFMNKLSEDIIRHPVIAKEFSKNPQLFLNKYGYHEPIDLDENILKLILALGDEDINKAVNAGDIKMTLKLMEEKNLLNDLAKSYTNVTLPEEQTKQLLALMGVEVNENECYSCGPGLCLVIILLAAIIYVGAATIAAAGVCVYVGFALEVYGPSASIYKDFGLLENNTPLKIWSLKGSPNDTYFAVNHYIENQVDKIIEAINSYENVKKFDEDKMREFLKLNILTQTIK
ncbi:hypothetical protein FACS1894195_5060 [Bacteroidia bacterium]|nr:hypothetical protein FACS1894195_5060 [Bacteroidia bacterium]